MTLMLCKLHESMQMLTEQGLFRCFDSFKILSKMFCISNRKICILFMKITNKMENIDKVQVSQRVLDLVYFWLHLNLGLLSQLSLNFIGFH